MSIVSLKLTDKQINELKLLLKDYKTVSPPDYANYRVNTSDLSVIIYDSKTVVFSKEKGIELSKLFKKVDVFPQAGSDETGNGSYFGPICVCAAYIDNETYEKIKHLNLSDSKTITDDYINEIGQFLRNNVKHSLLVLDNKTYNKLQKEINQNKMKAILHNQAFINLSKQIEMPKLSVIDQFTPKDTYYKYLKDEAEVFDKLIFETKAEGKYLSVAVASIIARFAFNVALMQMSKHYNFTFLSGANEKVDKNAHAFINKFSKNELNNVAKVHFANTKRLK